MEFIQLLIKNLINGRKSMKFLMYGNGPGILISIQIYPCFQAETAYFTVKGAATDA